MKKLLFLLLIAVLFAECNTKHLQDKKFYAKELYFFNKIDSAKYYSDWYESAAYRMLDSTDLYKEQFDSCKNFECQINALNQMKVFNNLTHLYADSMVYSDSMKHVYLDSLNNFLK